MSTKEEIRDGMSLFERGNVKQVKLEEQLLISFQKLVTATNNFHETNKLGQGGFGSVYRVNASS